MTHLRDIRYAARLLARSPGFSLLTVLVLAGGLGLGTFTFSFLYTAMMRPLPLSEGERIVRIDQLTQGRRGPVDAVDVGSLREQLRAVGEVGGYTGQDIVVGSEGVRRVVDATIADPVLFSVARTPALIGRALLAGDAEAGAEPVIVLSHRTWEVVFGADHAVLNRLVTINGVSTRVVGVMPAGFGFPVASEAWMPLPASTYALTEPGLASLRLVGRLAPGASHASASAEATPLLRRIVAARDTATAARSVEVAVESFPSVQIGEERTLVFTVLNVLAALILLLALVNVTNLLLARANERVRETAVRLALGATTGRLVMQGMWESVLLCLAGGIVGTAGAAWGLEEITRWTRANMEGNLAFWWVWRMDHVTLLCAGAFVTIAIAVLGGVTSWRATRTNVRAVLQDGSARAGSRREGRLSRALVATQVTTVTVLMFFGGNVGDHGAPRGRDRPGVRRQQPAAGESSRRRRDTVRRPPVPPCFRDVHARLAEMEALDGVLLREPGRACDRRRPLRAARWSRDGGAAVGVRPRDPGAVSTTGVTILEGRALLPSDDASRAPVVMVSRSLAARFWRGRSPLGDQVQLAGVGDGVQWRTIVGVASDVPYGDPLSRDRSPDAVYVPLLQSDAEYPVVVARFRGSEVAGREALHRAFGAVDPLLVPDGVQLFSEVLRKVGLITASVSRLFGACFAFALFLALAGAYGLMSRSIGLRRREIGVRRALGASDASLTRLLLSQGGRQLGVGTLVAAPMLVLTGLGFMHFFPIDGWIAFVAGVAVSLSIVVAVLGATWLPTRRVLRVTPRARRWARSELREPRATGARWYRQPFSASA
ncbi:MAG: ABC transporter permease [Gemmatimonadetes bacterium]|nr:ABC transporter permease [Gemmatimonadota bacterium]